MLFVFVDRLVYVYVTRPHEQLSEYVQHLIREKQFRAAVKALYERRAEQVHLSTRTVFFIVAWIPIGLYVITSTGSMLAAGLVMGVGLHLLFDMAEDWGNLERLKSWLFWQIKRPITDREAQTVIGVYVVAFVVLSLALI